MQNCNKMSCSQLHFIWKSWNVVLTYKAKWKCVEDSILDPAGFRHWLFVNDDPFIWVSWLFWINIATYGILLIYILDLFTLAFTISFACSHNLNFMVKLKYKSNSNIEKCVITLKCYLILDLKSDISKAIRFSSNFLTRPWMQVHG